MIGSSLASTGLACPAVLARLEAAARDADAAGQSWQEGRGEEWHRYAQFVNTCRACSASCLLHRRVIPP